MCLVYKMSENSEKQLPRGHGDVFKLQGRLKEIVYQSKKESYFRNCTQFLHYELCNYQLQH